MRYAPLLSPEERARAERYKSETRAAQFVTGRGLLRKILGEITGIPPADLQFAANEHGKPALAHEGLDLYFNVAHSKNAALIAVTRVGPVGVDLEALRPIAKLEQIAHRWFSDDDLSYLMDCDSCDRVARFFRLWTRKEALFKAWGVGLSWETARCVSVLHDQVFPASHGAPSHGALPGAPSQSVSKLPEPWGEDLHWSIRSWSPSPGYAAAVAAPGDSWRLVIQGERIDD